MQRISKTILLASIGGVVALVACSKTSESSGEISDDAPDSGRVVTYEIRRAEGGKGDSTHTFDLIVHDAFRTKPVGHIHRIVVEPQGAPLRVTPPPARTDSGVIVDTTHYFIKSPVPPKKLQ